MKDTERLRDGVELLEQRAVLATGEGMLGAMNRAQRRSKQGRKLVAAYRESLAATTEASEAYERKWKQ